MDALAEAIYFTVHKTHPRGAVGLAPLAGMKSGTLSNKADPAHDSELNLRESIPVMRAAGNYSILATVAAACDHGIIPLGEFERCSDTELLDLYCRLHEELGQTAAAIRSLISAGKVTRKAVGVVRREVIEDAQAGFALVARLDAIAEPDDA